MSAAVDRKKKLGRDLSPDGGTSEEPLAPKTGNNGNEMDAGQTPNASGLISLLPIPARGQVSLARFDDEALDQLAASIAQRGVIQLIIVTTKGQGRYQPRRGNDAGGPPGAPLHTIPAIVRS